MHHLLSLTGVLRHLDGLENHATIKFVHMIIIRNVQADFKYCFYLLNV